MTSLASRFIARITRRPPDYVIGGHEDPYLRRWWVVPRNRVLNVYLHQFLRSDDDRALHDHPWLFNASLMLVGLYREHTIAAGGIHRREVRKAGAFKFRWGPAPHRVELFPRAQLYGSSRPGQEHPLSCWTLFITGPVVRAWGFHCPEAGWVPWERFTSAADRGAIGRGCEG